MWVWLAFIFPTSMNQVLWEFKDMDYVIWSAGEKLISLGLANIAYYYC